MAFMSGTLQIKNGIYCVTEFHMLIVYLKSRDFKWEESRVTGMGQYRGIETNNWIRHDLIECQSKIKELHNYYFT